MFTGITLTNKGAEMLAAAQNGALLKFTRVQIGRGSLASGATEEAATSLVSPVKFLPIADYKNKGANVIVTFQITNADVTVAFTFRELGLFAKGDDGIEHLYAYSNAGASAETIPLPSETTVDYIMSLNLTVNSAENVTVVIDDALVYVTEKKLQEELEASKITVDDTVTANGENPVTGAAVAGYVDDLTYSDVGAAAAEHNHSAYDIDSGILPVSRGGTGASSVDTTPTIGSTKMVTSGGVATALSNKVSKLGGTMTGNLKFASSALTFSNTESAAYHTRVTRGTTADDMYFELTNTDGIMLRYMLKCPYNLTANANKTIATTDQIPEVDSAVTASGTNAVSGKAVAGYTAQEVTADGAKPVSGAAVYAFVTEQILGGAW